VGSKTPQTACFQIELRSPKVTGPGSGSRSRRSEKGETINQQDAQVEKLIGKETSAKGNSGQQGKAEKKGSDETGSARGKRAG